MMTRWMSLLFHGCLFCAALLFVLVVGREGGVVFQNAHSILNHEQAKIDKIHIELQGLKKDAATVSKEKDQFLALEKRAVFTSLDRVALIDLIKEEAKKRQIQGIKIELQPDELRDALGVRRRITPLRLTFDAPTDREVWQFVRDLQKTAPGIVRLESARIEREKEVAVRGELAFTITKLKVGKR